MFEHPRAWRHASGLTLQEVARLLETTHSTILRYEKGHLQVSADAVRRLAEIYGCTPAELECDPDKREAGKRLHDAMEIVKSLPPNLSDKWLDIGRILLEIKDEIEK